MERISDGDRSIMSDDKLNPSLKEIGKFNEKEIVLKKLEEMKEVAIQNRTVAEIDIVFFGNGIKKKKKATKEEFEAGLVDAKNRLGRMVAVIKIIDEKMKNIK